MEQKSIKFLRDSLVHHRSLKNSLDQKASFLVAIAGVIFGLSIGRLDEIHFLVLAVASFLAVLLSIIITFLPFRGKLKGKFGLMCWWGFSNKSFEEYEAELKKSLVSDEKIAQEYAKEIWGLANYSLKPKTRILKWASIILILGLLGGFVLFFV